MAYNIKSTKKLEPKYDSSKSFYGKAKVRREDGKLILTSYTTDVAEIENGKAKVNGLYSDTTTRHIKEFLIQNGFKAENSKQIMKDYGVKENLTTFGTITPSGEVKNTMVVDLSKVKSDDALAYAYGFSQGKSGTPMSKAEKGDKLAPEYIRGYKDGKEGKEI